MTSGRWRAIFAAILIVGAIVAISVFKPVYDENTNQVTVAPKEERRETVRRYVEKIPGLGVRPNQATGDDETKGSPTAEAPQEKPDDKDADEKPDPEDKPESSSTPSESEVVKYGSAKDLFEVQGTPEGFKFDGVSSPSKATLCKKKYKGTLVKSVSERGCRTLNNGQRECKMVCKLPNGKIIGKADFDD
jgi:hypothetical protein